MEPGNKANRKQLYPYQQSDLEKIFERLEQNDGNHRLLYRLPTGGGKTVIFSQIAKRFIGQYGRKVMVLTHRIELCRQTSATLKNSGISNQMIDSHTKTLDGKKGYDCYVAMVETLKNRIREGQLDPAEFGLVIIDEAHHNSFQKLLGKFKHASVIGVTATPFSSDISLPMRKNYDELILGESIASLIDQGYLAKPKTWRYDVELNTLKTGDRGDYTVSSSDILYSSPAMLNLLVHAYEAHAKNKKTLIFNNGIFTSRNVCKAFEDAGYEIRHLDNQTSPSGREEILAWFKKTKNAILTSVSLLTTGFDEPSIQAVILYRATKSITLYHQMIGRGSRRLPKKKTFTVIDLGNNADRFGAWEIPVDWQYVFEHPEAYYESLHQHTAYESHGIPADVRSKFPNTLEISFDVQGAYHEAVANHQKPKTVIRDSIRQHALMCAGNAESISEALELAAGLDKEIHWRVKQYAKCLGKVTKNYTEWLEEDYKVKLRGMVQRIMQRGIEVGGREALVAS